MLGLGPYPVDAQVDPDVINAGKETITELDRTSYVSSADSFAMIRGGHIDLAILGAMEVSQTGDIANWIIPGKMVKGMGGAMDLVAGARRIIVLMDHLARDGTPKFRKKCTLPLTGANAVDMIITNMAVFVRAERRGHFQLIETARNITVADIRAMTEADYEERIAANRS
jgi:3-oxoacid CoA-transferase subunit B